MTGDGEGGMSDVLKRLGAVETSVVELKTQVGVIVATLPHLATKAAVDSIAAVIPSLATKAAVDSIATVIPSLATKATVDGILATLPHLATKADLSALETKIIKWIIATVLTTAGVVFSIAKLVH
jgi:hypothetical protein